MDRRDELSERPPVTNAALWWEGFRCGLVNLPYARTPFSLRQCLRLLLCPVDLWRYHEFRAVLHGYGGERDVLDIGSPKLLATFIARNFGAVVTSTDIVRQVEEECVLYERAAWQGALDSRRCDARALPFADRSFDFIYSVSVLEHIASDGDTRAIREIARVLKPGGRAVVTVPLVPAYHERWVDADPYGEQKRNADGQVFFSRYYDWPSLEERIIEPSGLVLGDVQAWQECCPGWYARYCVRTTHAASPLSIVTKLLDPVWSRTELAEVLETPPRVTSHGLVSLTLHRSHE